MFKDIKVSRNGAEVKKLATRKIGLLKVRITQLKQAVVDVANYNMSEIQKDEIIKSHNKNIELINDSVEFLQVMVDCLPDENTLNLSLKEMNFLINQYQITYYG